MRRKRTKAHEEQRPFGGGIEKKKKIPPLSTTVCEKGKRNEEGGEKGRDNKRTTGGGRFYISKGKRQRGELIRSETARKKDWNGKMTQTITKNEDRGGETIDNSKRERTVGKLSKGDKIK